MTKNILFFSEINEINENEKKHVGGKGWNLAQLSTIGINVPAGFVIPSDLFLESIHEFKTLLDDLEKQFNQQVLIKLQKKILEIDLSKLTEELDHATVKLQASTFAVRSSANVEDSPQQSFAGQFKTILSVNPNGIAQAIKECWAAAFSEQSIQYFKQHNLPLTSLQLAVIIQVQLNSEYSGIAFTTHPMTNNQEQMVIEGGWGLGEMLVAGQVTPTTWIVDKATEKVVEVLEGNQEKQLIIQNGKVVEEKVEEDKRQTNGLDEKLLQELIQQMKKIEQHFGKPQDIEWAVEKDKLYILQARPITTI